MEKTRKCPYCGEEIMADARKCKHCGEWLTDEAEPKQEPVQETGRKEPESQLRNDVLATTAAVNEPIADSVPSEPKETLFKSCFWEQITKHYCDFKGNVDRKTFWVCYLYYSLIMLVTAGISAIAPLAGTILMTVVSLGLLLPFLGLMVRRLHDIGKKGAWILISLVPLVGAIWLLVLLAKKGETQNPNKWSGKDTIVSIAMVVTSVVLFAIGLFGIGSDSSDGSELLFNNETNNETEEIKNQVLDALSSGTIHNLMTPEFKAADEAVSEVEGMFGEIFHDSDIFYGTQDEVPEGFKASEVNFVGKDKAYVKVMFVYRFNHELVCRDSIVLTMVRDNDILGQDEAKWLVDDVMSFYDNNGHVVSYSQKEAMNEFVDETLTTHAYVEDETESGFTYEVDEFGNEYMVDEEGVGYYRGNVNENDEDEADSNNKYVVIDATELRLRLAPSTSSETLKWGDGSNRHPEVGEKFRLLDESGDFYKIDFNGNNVWVSKQYTHIELRKQKGENNQLEIGSGQSENDDKADEIFQVVEEMPVFPGGETKLLEYISNNIQYPQVARETGIQGRVFIGFVVEPDGSISNVKLLRGIGGGCDEEAIRVVKSMPKWKPGKQRGKVVRVSYQIPISFKLT